VVPRFQPTDFCSSGICGYHLLRTVARIWSGYCPKSLGFLSLVRISKPLTYIPSSAPHWLAAGFATPVESASEDGFCANNHMHAINMPEEIRRQARISVNYLARAGSATLVDSATAGLISRPSTAAICLT
jgi:hypothetical protein